MNKVKIAVLSKDSKEIIEILHKISKSNRISNEDISLYYYEDVKDILNARVDLLLIDTAMGKEKTLDAIRKIKNNDYKYDTNIITCLDSVNINSLQEYIDLGVNDYILKPYTPQIMEIRIYNQILIIKSVKDSKTKNIQFDALLNNTPYMAWFKDKDSNYIKVNNEFREHCGKTFEEIQGRSDHYVWDGNIGEQCREYDLEVMVKRERVVFNEIIPGKKGYRQFNVYKAPVINEYDEVIGTIGIARDITDLKDKDARIQILMDNIPFAVWLNDKNGILLDANKKFVEHHNTTLDRIIGKATDTFCSEEEYTTIKNEDKEVMDKKEPIKVVKTIETIKGKRHIEVYKTPVFAMTNEVIGVSGVIVDVTDLKEAKSQIKNQALTDPLTGTYNRRALYELINEKSNIKKLGIMVIDIDNFKDINDIYGHNIGDKALVWLTKRIKEVCTNGDLFRLGGDEFVVIFSDNIDEESMCKKADEILEKISEGVTYKNQHEQIYVSIGVVICKYSNNIDRLLNKGDIALYKAKENGKNQYVLYTKELEDEKNLYTNIERDLKHAIDNDEINLYYQPQYTKDNVIKGFEALFRWNKEKYANIPIIKIIEIMEKSKLIISIGKQIVYKAFSFAKRINENREDKIVISVNISAVQIMDDDFIFSIKDIIEKLKVDVSCIGIEITETVLLENIDENIKKIEELKNMGIEIALDDFGTGYSSFNYLIQLPLSLVKVDQSFIKGMDIRNEYIKLVKLMIDSSHSLNLPIVAEGVESKEQFNRLKCMDIDYVQGYYFSKPLPEKEALKLIKR